MHVQHDVITLFYCILFQIESKQSNRSIKTRSIVSTKSMSILREKIILMIYCELFSLTVPTSWKIIYNIPVCNSFRKMGGQTNYALDPLTEFKYDFSNHNLICSIIYFIKSKYFSCTISLNFDIFVHSSQLFSLGGWNIHTHAFSSFNEMKQF